MLKAGKEERNVDILKANENIFESRKEIENSTSRIPQKHQV